MIRVIFHIDLNAFFANVEVAQNPKLKNKPIVIAHDSKRSVVSTASYEAREFGIHSAMPLFMAKEKCPNIIVVPPHFQLYRDYSNKFFNIIKRFTYKVQIASIDECYVDMSDYITETKIHPLKLAKQIQDTVYKELQLSCSIGVSPNKFLSKMASDYQKPFGLTMITQSNIKEILWPLPVDKMHGIGKMTAPKLKELDINTIRDIANYDNYQSLRMVLGKNALIFYNLANGKDNRPVVYEEKNVKSMSHSETFDNDITDIEVLREQLKILVDNVTKRAVNNDLYTNNISITIKYNRFHQITRQMHTNHFTNDFLEIDGYAQLLLNQAYNHQPVRLLGITLNNITNKEDAREQISIFDKQSDPTKNLLDSLKKVDHSIKYAKDLLKDK